MKLVVLLFFLSFSLLGSSQGQFTFIVTPESCNNCTDGAIDMTLSGCGVGDYTVLWTAPNGFTSADEDLSGLDAGEFCVVVTDENAEEFEACVTVPVGGDVETITENIYCFQSPDGCNLCNCTLIYFNVNGQQPNGEACIQTPDCWSGPVEFIWTDQYGYNVGNEACTQGLVGGNYQVSIESAEGGYVFFVFYLDGTGGFGTVYEEVCEPDGIFENDLERFRVFPNPTEGTIHLQFSGHVQDLNLNIQNMTGKLIEAYSNVGNGQAISLSSLSSGVYLMTVSTSEGKVIGRESLIVR